MLRRALPALLALIVLVCDLSGGHAAALAFVLLAIPAAFVFALDCYGDTLDARCGRLRPLCAAAGLALLVLSAALRSPAVVGGVPQLAVSAVVLCLLLYGTVLVAALFAPRPASSAAAGREADTERLAA